MGKKKEGRIAKVFRLNQEGLKPKEIAAKLRLSERVVRAYLWRAKNPQKYKALLNRYREKKKTKQNTAKNKNAPEEKAA